MTTAPVAARPVTMSPFHPTGTPPAPDRADRRTRLRRHARAHQSARARQAHLEAIAGDAPLSGPTDEAADRARRLRVTFCAGARTSVGSTCSKPTSPAGRPDASRFQRGAARRGHRRRERRAASASASPGSRASSTTSGRPTPSACCSARRRALPVRPERGRRRGASSHSGEGYARSEDLAARHLRQLHPGPRPVGDRPCHRPPAATTSDASDTVASGVAEFVADEDGSPTGYWWAGRPAIAFAASAIAVPLVRALRCTRPHRGRRTALPGHGRGQRADQLGVIARAQARARVDRPRCRSDIYLARVTGAIRSA